MNSVVHYRTSVVVRKASRFLFTSRKFCNGSIGVDVIDNGIEESLKITWDSSEMDCGFDEEEHGEKISVRRRFLESAKLGASRVLDTLQQDCPGFNTKSALDELNVTISGLLVREVLVGILKTLSYDNKTRCAKLAYKFFVWCGGQESFRHKANCYHLLLKIFAECGEYKAMCRLIDEMIKDGYPATARTFNLLICTCGEAGLARDVVEQFIKSKTFNYRPFKHSYNAILHSLLGVKQYKLIDWVDGLSRAGKLEACQYFMDEMVKVGCTPDVVCYTVMITGYISGGELEKAEEMFKEMTEKGQLPNVLTYNSMIRGFCMAGKFKEACSLLKEMESRGCNPNFVVYSTLVNNLRNAGKVLEAHEVVKDMVEKGHYAHLISKLKKYRRS